MKQRKREFLIAEKVFGSQVAMAMLRTLIQRDMPLPISRIAKEIGSNYVTVRKHIKLLEEANLVNVVEYGKRKLYRTNKANERIQALKDFIQAWSKHQNEPKEGR